MMSRSLPRMTEQTLFDVLHRAWRDGRLDCTYNAADAARLGFAVPPGATPLAPGELVICGLCDDDHPLMFLDNEVAPCSGCGRRVQFRPGAPASPKACAYCAVALLLAAVG